MTVSNVVNGRPGPAAATRERVEAAIRELGYVRDAGAHALRVGRATALGFLMEDESRLALHDPSTPPCSPAWSSGRATAG